MGVAPLSGSSFSPRWFSSPLASVHAANVLAWEQSPMPDGWVAPRMDEDYSWPHRRGLSSPRLAERNGGRNRNVL